MCVKRNCMCQNSGKPVILRWSLYECCSALIWMLHIQVRTRNHRIFKLYGPSSKKVVIFCVTSMSISSLPCLFGFKETVWTEPVNGVYRRNTAAGGWCEVFCHDRRKLPFSDPLLNNVLCSVPTAQKMLHLHYKHQPVNAAGEVITVCCENDAEHINIPCGQNSGFLSIKVVDKYIKWFIDISDHEACQFKI